MERRLYENEIVKGSFNRNFDLVIIRFSLCFLIFNFSYLKVMYLKNLV